MPLDFTARTAIVVGDQDPFSEAIVDRLAHQGATVWRANDAVTLGNRLRDDAVQVDVLILTLDRPSEAALLGISDEEIDSVLDRQLRRIINVVRLVLPRMRDADYGRIVACVPSSGLFGADPGVAISIAAAGVVALTRSIAQANLDRDIRANLVSYIAVTPSTDTLFEAHPVLEPALFDIAMVLPAITYLAHRDCVLNGETVSAGAGRFAKAFTSVSLGVLAPMATDDEFGSLLPKVIDTRSTFSPRTVVDELITITV